MIRHISLGASAFSRSRKLSALLRDGQIMLAGNIRLKIYGTLHGHSGKRMKIKNRVFFRDETQAISHGFRPCGHYLRAKYLQWKNKKEWLSHVYSRSC